MKRHELPSDYEDASRAQILLIGALVITFSLIVLVLLLNNVLFVQNVESQGVSSDAVEVSETRQLVRQNAGEVLIRINSGDFGGNTDAYVRENVSTLMSALSDQNKAVHGTSLSLVSIDSTDGVIVRQTDGGNFSNQTEEAQDWQLASGVEEVRRFQIGVNESDLASDSLTDLDIGLVKGDVYHVNVTDGSSWWNLYIYGSSSSPDEIVVASATNGDTDVTIHYQEPVDNATVDLTTGRVNGQKVFEFAPNVGTPYEIRFANGDKVFKGNYTMVFNDTTSLDVNVTNVNSSGARSPYSTVGVYSLSLMFEQQSVRSIHTGNLTVVPCTPDDDTCPRDIDPDGPLGSGISYVSDPPVPVIADAYNTSIGGSEYNVTVEWNVTDDEELQGGDVNEIRLVNNEGTYEVEDISDSLSGKSANGTYTFTNVKDTGSTDSWKVVVEITDDDGNTNSTSEGVLD